MMIVILLLGYYTKTCIDWLFNPFVSIFLLFFTLHKLCFDNFSLNEDDDDDV